MWGFTVWIIAIVFVAFFIFSVVFTLISCSDLEGNYLGPIEMVHRLNQVMPFEYGAHLLLTFLFLSTMNVLEFILNIPLAAFNIWLFINGKHKLDEIRILQDENLPNLRKRELVKLIFFILCFFLYLYNLISTALETSHHADVAANVAHNTYGGY